MQQYIITVPETKHAQNLLNYIIQTGYFSEVRYVDFIEKELQKQHLKKELTEAFEEVELIRQGKLKKQTLTEFLNEL